MNEYLDRIDRSTIRHAMAYVDAAGALADFVRQSGRSLRPLASVMACAGTVTGEVRRSIEQVFGARVHNKYGSRDASDMACECEAGGLHIYSHHVHLEVVDERGNPCAAGQTGRLLVTLLGNFSFPLIRYEIGDAAALRTGLCPCGRPFPLLDRIEGRTVEFLRSTCGGYISPVYLRHLVGVAHNPGFIRRFQVVQESGLRYTLALEIPAVVDAAAYGAVEQALRHGLAEVLGRDAQLEIARTDALPVPASGKFLYTLNRWKGRP